MPDQDYLRVENAIKYLQQTAQEQPSLEQVARQVGLSSHHFQRLFRRYAGVSPKRFLQHLTCDHAKKLLRQSHSVLDTSFEVGLSSPGRLHDLLINAEALTPGEVRSGGAGVQINYGFHSTPFGDCLLAQTERGICRLEFFTDGERDSALERLHTEWPQAQIRATGQLTAPTIARIFSHQRTADSPPLTLMLRGTNFQLKVWQALLNIPPGAVTSYGDLARRIGRPGASRALGSAVGQNPIGYLIPCHRVLRADGGIGGYRWGIERKMLILSNEWNESDTADRLKISQ